MIRATVQCFRKHALSVPNDAQLWIACSGGADSTALAVLLARHGKNIVPRDRITLLHVHHGWRGLASDEDADAVKALAETLGVSFRLARVPPPDSETGSWEEDAREKRLQEFASVLTISGEGSFLVTAHTQEDLAETALWRFATGTFWEKGGGIFEWEEEKRILRPFLKASKAALLEFLKEEKVSFREDHSNADPRFLRARIRQEILPGLNRVFPRAMERIAEFSLSLQEENPHEAEKAPLSALLRAARVRLRRGNHVEMRKLLGTSSPGFQELSLPEGWRLTREGVGTWKLYQSKDKENR